MIIREITKKPDEVLANFDWFNDYRDTRKWLAYGNVHHKNSALIKRLDEEYQNSQMEMGQPQCAARQVSDQMECKVCDLAWDMNDGNPPACKRQSKFRRSSPHAIDHMTYSELLLLLKKLRDMEEQYDKTNYHKDPATIVMNVNGENGINLRRGDLQRARRLLHVLTNGDN